MATPAEPDLSRYRAAIQLRDRCVEAALRRYADIDLEQLDVYARAAYDAMADIIREDEQAASRETVKDLALQSAAVLLQTATEKLAEIRRAVNAHAQTAPVGDGGLIRRLRQILND